MKKFLIACALLCVFSSVGLFAEQSLSIAPQGGCTYGFQLEGNDRVVGGVGIPIFGGQVDWMISDNWGLGGKCAFGIYNAGPPVQFGFVGLVCTYQFDNGFGLSLVLGVLPGIEIRYANFMLDLGFVVVGIDGIWGMLGTVSLGYSLRLASW
jgi:hypothetical protein